MGLNLDPSFSTCWVGYKLNPNYESGIDYLYLLSADNYKSLAEVGN